MATVVTARWDYADTDVDWGAVWHDVHRTVPETFGDHYSPSVQYTLYRMGEAALEARPEIERIHLSLPNKHHLLADLSPFGFRNDNEIFVPTDEPFGLIEAVVRRG